MVQLPLFEPRQGTLLDDEWGRLTYLPRLVAPATAQASFAQLRPTVPWKGERRFMYDRRVDVPRLTAHFRLLPGPGDPLLPPALVAAARRVCGHTGVRYETQLHYTHAVPKTPQAVGQRISLAFRVKPAAGPGSGPQRY